MPVNSDSVSDLPDGYSYFIGQIDEMNEDERGRDYSAACHDIIVIAKRSSEVIEMVDKYKEKYYPYGWIQCNFEKCSKNSLAEIFGSSHGYYEGIVFGDGSFEKFNGGSIEKLSMESRSRIQSQLQSIQDKIDFENHPKLPMETEEVHV